jgi:hypothetical protein
MILSYMKAAGLSSAEIEMKAKEYIGVGYQRLLTYEIAGGGFDWFGNPPADTALTAIGLMEFSDMEKVFEIDHEVITRTQKWLADVQEPDGYWKVKQGPFEITSISWDITRATAYVVWALAYSGYASDAVTKGLSFLKAQYEKETLDTYTLAVIAIAFASAKNNAYSDTTGKLLDDLAKRATETEEDAYWASGEKTMTGAYGDSANIETSALAAYAFITSNSYIPLINKAINWLIKNKGAYGNWGTTQGTVLVLKALTKAAEGLGESITGELEVFLNGESVGKHQMDQTNSDVMWQLELGEKTLTGDNLIELNWIGKGRLPYQVSYDYYLPWNLVPKDPEPPLTITVEFDKTTLNVDDMVKVLVNVKNNTATDFGMIIVDLGIPPGFEVVADDFNKYITDGKISKIAVTDRQVTVYLVKLLKDEPLTLVYNMKALYPMKASVPSSDIYSYYNPDTTKSESGSFGIEVK